MTLTFVLVPSCQFSRAFPASSGEEGRVMAKTAAKVMAIAALAGEFLASVPASASGGDVFRVVLHVTDYQRVPRGELANAQKRAARPYQHVGIRLVWTDRAARDSSAEAAQHLEVVILSDEMTRNKMPTLDALGEASPITKRAYIHYSRVLVYARKLLTPPVCVLAGVLAHEIGHMLLPEQSHTPSGLMSADIEGHVGCVPDFLPAQAATMRAMLAPN